MGLFAKLDYVGSQVYISQATNWNKFFARVPPSLRFPEICSLIDFPAVKPTERRLALTVCEAEHLRRLICPRAANIP